MAMHEGFGTRVVWCCRFRRACPGSRPSAGDYAGNRRLAHAPRSHLWLDDEDHTAEGDRPRDPQLSVEAPAPPGDRWVATQIRIRGLRGQWVDGPSGDGRVVDTQQHRYRAFPAGYGTVEVR